MLSSSPICLSVIIPAYNEEERIERTVQLILNYLKKTIKKFEIMVVDDGSRDATVSKVMRLAKQDRSVKCLTNGRNLGKGSAVKKGMLAATGKYCLFSDADLSTPINELTRMLKVLQKEKLGIVIGSRVLAKEEQVIRQPWYRAFIRFIFNKVVMVLAVQGIHDTQCGFKLFSREAARDIFVRQRIRRFGFDVELLYIAQKRNWSIKELPVSWFYSAGTKVHYLKDGVQMVLDLIRIRFYDILGYYS